MRNQCAAFANFICTFGVKKVMLDFIEELIYPAFTDKKYKRTARGGTTYFFEGVTLKVLAEGEIPTLGLCGRFVKNTTLKRVQVYDGEKGIVADPQSMPTAPSAFFVLILNSHQLIYFAETPYAPEIKEFEITIRSFVRAAYNEYVRKMKEYINERSEKKTTLKAIMLEFPPPTLNVIPLSNESSVTDFLSQFSKIQKIDIELVRPNAQFDADAILSSVQQYTDELEPDRTFLRTEKASGFEMEEAKKKVTEASASGLRRVTVTGRDHVDGYLKGNNDKFNLLSSPKEPSKDPDKLSVQLFDLFKNLCASGTIKVNEIIDSVAAKIIHIRTLL